MSDDSTPLAAVVPKGRTGTAIEALRSEGIYDADRRIREHGEETTAIPVTDPPASLEVETVVRQVDPSYRTRGLEDYLAERGWGESALERAPKSWSVVGSVVVVRLPPSCPDERAVGEALLELHGNADSVLALEAIDGPTREPETRLIAGSGATETVHREGGTQYRLDPRRVMFSPGNKAERTRMGTVVAADERVFDMFAGIGYFALPMARAGASVVTAEINPTAFRYLLEGAALNGVTDRIDAYRGDCRAVAERIEPVDRVVMGHYGAGEDRGERDDYLEAALSVLAPGGTVHHHASAPAEAPWAGPEARLAAVADAAGRSIAVEGRRRVKRHGPGRTHVVIDATVAGRPA